jgi:hypothetical protein
MQDRPHLVATPGETALVMVHLRQSAVAPFNRRGSPLKTPGMLSRPRCPPRQHVRRQLLGEGVRLTRLRSRLQHPSQLGFASGATGVRSLCLPRHQRQQEVCHPSLPPWWQRDLRLPIVPDLLPPGIHEGGDTCELLADFVSGVLLERHPMRVDPCCKGRDRRVPLAFHVL